MEHSHPTRLRAAYVIAADALVTYTVDASSQEVRVLHIGTEPPEYMS